VSRLRFEPGAYNILVYNVTAAAACSGYMQSHACYLKKLIHQETPRKTKKLGSELPTKLTKEETLRKAVSTARVATCSVEVNPSFTFMVISLVGNGRIWLIIFLFVSSVYILYLVTLHPMLAFFLVAASLPPILRI
jgi:hypothetical protein